MISKRVFECCNWYIDKFSALLCRVYNLERKVEELEQGGGGGGITKLSQLEIDADKDWLGRSISNIGTLSAENLEGSLHGGYIEGEDSIEPSTIPLMSTNKRGMVPPTGTPVGNVLSDYGTWVPQSGGGGTDKPKRTFYASDYATAQEAVDAAKGQRLVLDKTFEVTAPVTLFGSEYEGTHIVGTDNKGTGFKAVGAFDGFVLDIRANYITLENFTIDGGTYDGVGGLAIGDRSVQQYTAYIGSVTGLIIKNVKGPGLGFFDQVDYWDFFNIRIVDGILGRCIRIENPAGSVYDNGHVRFFGGFFSGVQEVLSRSAQSATFHRVLFDGCQFVGGQGAQFMVDTSLIHEVTFVGCDFECYGGIPSSAVLKLNGWQQTLIGCSFNGNNQSIPTIVVMEGAYSPYTFHGISINNFTGSNTVAFNGAYCIGLETVRFEQFEGSLGPSYYNLHNGPTKGWLTVEPTLEQLPVPGMMAVAHIGEEYKLFINIDMQIKSVTLS